MWELAKTPSHGGNSVRRILTFVLTAVIAAFLWVIMAGALTNAASDQASWDSTGSTLSYEGNQYTDAGQAQAGNSAGIPATSEYYTFTQPISGATATSETDIIYFAAGKTPASETSATYAVYDTNTAHAPPTYSNPHDKTTITVQPSSSSNGSSCTIQGIGWLICPISNNLAQGMDWLSGVLGTFIAVQPLNVTDTHNDIYVAWNVMRSIANVAFIIVFLIIIYSQLTSTAVNNYGLKKLLPRLIVGVIIVNLSYTLCAIFLDASNILGSSLQGLFSSIQTSVAHTNADGLVNTNEWQNIVGASLAGTSVGAGAVIGGVVLNSSIIGASSAGLFYLLLPILLGLFLAVLVVILILAVRQALIIILIIISPLAFVAYLLPNTEKWFKQWQKTFTTMLVFFPAFSIVYGGAQLAGMLIVKNANSLTLVVLGMAVQLAPLAISPLLFRLSGSTIQGIAKAAQGFNKRIQGATGNWAKTRRELHRDESLARQGTRNPFRSNAQYWNARGQRVQERSQIAKQGVANMYNGNGFKAARRNPQKWHDGLNLAHHEGEERKEFISTRDALNWSNHQLTDPHAQLEAQALNTITQQSTAAKNRIETNAKVRTARSFHNSAEFRAMSAPMQQLIIDAQVANEDIAAQAMRGNIAIRAVNQDFAKRLKADVNLRNLAGAVEIDAQGAESALASAINTVNEAYGKSVAEARTVLNNFNVDSRAKQDFAKGLREITGRDDDGNSYTFALDNIFTREAAIEDQVAGGGVSDVEELVALSGNTLRNYRKTITDGIAKNSSLREKALYLGGETLDDIAQGRIQSEKDIMVAVTRAIANGKIAEKQLAALDPKAAQRLAEAAAAIKRGDAATVGSTTDSIKMRQSDINNLPDRVTTISETAKKTFTGDERGNILGVSRKSLGDLARVEDPSFRGDQEDNTTA